jgi:hypothetical protein
MKRIKKLMEKINREGIPLPMLTDPKTGLGSVSLTAFFISFNVYLLGMLTRWAGYLGGIDMNWAQNLLVLTAGLYFGRKLTSKDGNIELGTKKKKR